MLERASIFPYVAPESYLEVLGKGNYVAWDYSGELAVMLVSDIGAGVKSVSPDQVEQLGLSDEGAWALAFENLHRVFEAGAIPLGVGELSYGTKAFVVGPHWLASAFSLHPGLYLAAVDALATADLRMLVPSRDSVVVVATSCFARNQEAIVKLASELRGQSLKPFAPNVFSLGQNGVAGV